MEKPLVQVTGQLICADMSQMLTAMELLPDHVAQSRAEPGCLRFDLSQDDDPLIWNLNEIFADKQAYAAHQYRTGDSKWGAASDAFRREYHRNDVLPRIRPETLHDHQAITELLDLSFGTPGEAELVCALREAGDLTVSLVADVGGLIVGHIALSPLKADRPGLALAPLAVHPALQNRGIGAALVKTALKDLADHSILILGDPAYYGRFGFKPAKVTSPYAGPYLLVAGPGFDPGQPVEHAAAFQALR